MKQELKVVFRKFENDEVIALFPQFTNKNNYKIESYILYIESLLN